MATPCAPRDAVSPCLPGAATRMAARTTVSVLSRSSMYVVIGTDHSDHASGIPYPAMRPRIIRQVIPRIAR